MAKLENESSNSSSAEEEELSSDSSASESEPDKTSTPPPSSKKTQLTSDDESETDSGSDSGAEKDKVPANEKSLVPYPNIKPLASKPMDEVAVEVSVEVSGDGGGENSKNSKKPRSKNPTSRYSPPPLKSSTGKRAAAAEADGGRNKKKTVMGVAARDAEEVNNGGGGEKKLLFQRLWSETNEIELIQAMISYVQMKGKDPMADINDFYEFAKNTVNVNVTIRQMITKIRRLKKKFENNVVKVENKGRVRSLSNPHEKEMYELSKILWGVDGTSNGIISSKGKKVNVTPKTSKGRKVSKGEGSGNGNGGTEVASQVTPIEVEPRAVVQSVPVPSGNGIENLGILGMPITDETIMTKGLELVTGEKRAELLARWKNLKVFELKNFVEKVKLLKEQAEVVLSAVENSGAN